MAIKIDLRPKRAPCGYAHIAKTEIFVDEVKIIVQAFGLRSFEKGFVCCLVVPRCIGQARLAMIMTY